MGRRLLAVTGELLVDIFMAGPPRSFSILENGLPEDTKLIEMGFGMVAPEQRIVVLVLESAAWDEQLVDGVPTTLPPVKVGLIPLIVDLRPPG